MIQGPFTLRGSKESGWDVEDATGTRVLSITATLIDGSGRRDKYPNAVIRTREQRKEEAEFVIDALNSRWHILEELQAQKTVLAHI